MTNKKANGMNVKDNKECLNCGKKLSEHSYFYDSCKYKPMVLK